MPTIGFSTLQCNTLTHGGGGNDNVRLIFMPDMPTTFPPTPPFPPLTFWPRTGSAIEFSENMALEVDLRFTFTNNLIVTLVNYHQNNSKEPESLGMFEYKADGSGKGYTSFTEEDSSYTLTYEYFAPDAPISGVQLLGVKCVKPATAIDEAVIDAVTAVASKALEAFGSVLKEAPDKRVAAVGVALDAAAGVLEGVPVIAKAIADAGNYDDQLYITLGDKNSKNQKIYPVDAEYIDMNVGSTVSLEYFNLKFPVMDVDTFSLFDHDVISDDWLGSFTIDPSLEEGVGSALVLGHPSEGSIYIVSYSINHNKAV